MQRQPLISGSGRRNGETRNSPPSEVTGSTLPRERLITGSTGASLRDQRQVAAGEVDHELAQIVGVGLDEAGDAAAADPGADADGDGRLHRRPLAPSGCGRTARAARRARPARRAARRPRYCRRSRPRSGSRSAARGPCPRTPAARSRPTGGARSGTPRPGSGRSRGRAAAGRSRAGSRRGTSETCSARGLVSGRQTHSPLPRHIESPSESWISSRHSSVPRRSFSPNQNMLVMGAMPRRSIGLRGKSWAVTSIVVTAARRDGEAVGAGDALALEQRVGGHAWCRSGAAGPARSG